MKTFFYSILSLVLILVSNSLLLAQDNDQAKFEKSEPGFYDEIKKSINDFNEPVVEDKLKFTMDYAGKDLPKSLSEFNYYWHT